MYGEETYRKEYGKQVEKYLAAFGLTEEDLGKLINSSSDNVRDIVKGAVGLSLGKMIKIANVFSVHYYQFADPAYPLPEERHLSRSTRKKIEKRKSIGIIVRDNQNLLAKELDRLISIGFLSKPVTASMLHQAMDKSLSNRNSTEISNLLIKRPRNQIIAKLSAKVGKQNLYIHKDFLKNHEPNGLDLFQSAAEQDNPLK
ncbi:helix-turn-helix domain-containing protein [Sphingobacterium deserti]|uniref:HTH cro/C1-type domain-containing protein n=1 Tax=Sphingobacterium deserti TaxID=1229276 RepID=A0A0B8SYM0_9SPHI|nr:helix-turn-helix transcriptional regulator [Sphingobacterium deserti]KGE12352.1 hypothetical protein DI53_3841 [Sphingobacterium deserti]